VRRTLGPVWSDLDLLAAARGALEVLRERLNRQIAWLLVDVHDRLVVAVEAAGEDRSHAVLPHADMIRDRSWMARCASPYFAGR